jgi:two-component system NtrC family sensor kinase
MNNSFFARAGAYAAGGFSRINLFIWPERQGGAMLALNLRQKMIGCFCLHLLFYIVVGGIFIKDFEAFRGDVTLLMHGGNLSNICLEIRRYEKNFIIRHHDADFSKVLEYVGQAQATVPKVVNDLRIASHPVYLQDLSDTLILYKKSFEEFKETCTSESTIIECPSREVVRNLGQDLVKITDELVLFQQNKMNKFIAKVKVRLAYTVILLVVLSIFTIVLLYYSIIIPLKQVENAAKDIAHGTFTLLSVDEKKGEVRSVLRAFNKMVQELEEKQEQLFQAKKLSSIGTLAAGTAHQINNPLNNIGTSCQLALADIDREQCPFVVKMLETIDQETQRAGDIVRSLLEFSRAQTFSLQPFSLQELVKKVTQLVASEVPAGVNIETDISEEILLYIDVQKMIEALLNLTINAIQAISDPPGLIRIRAEKDVDHKNALITISDTGKGIDKDNLPKIFDPFFTTKNAENGTGLGLAVVYGIIKKHHGSIAVESEQGKGSRFIITLPLHHGFDGTEPVGIG